MTSKEGSMTQIKICGFTDPKEAAFVSYPDVSYMGMVLFFEKSKRNISLETAKAIMRAADPRIPKVAVVVSPTPAQAEEIEKAGFDYMQVHGVLGAEVLSMTRLPIIRAYNGKAEEEEDPRICAHLFDAAEPGSGQAFDWKRLAEKKRKKPWFLAGGLTAANVGRAISLIHPDVVDVSSGVEYTDRKGKDPEKIAAFIQAAKKLMLDAELRGHPSAAMGNISSLCRLQDLLDP